MGMRYDSSIVTFQTIPMWIQIWGLPFDLLTEETGRDIGMGLGEVVEIDTTAFTLEKARFIRIRIELPLDKPIRRRGLYLAWREIKYGLASNMKGWLVCASDVDGSVMKQKFAPKPWIKEWLTCPTVIG
nr:hypothetical protein CFP56_48895 [Quercus suber]